MKTHLLEFPQPDEAGQDLMRYTCSQLFSPIPSIQESIMKMPFDEIYKAYQPPPSDTGGGRNVSLFSCALFFKELGIKNETRTYDYLWHLYDDGNNRKYADIERAFSRVYNDELIKGDAPIRYNKVDQDPATRQLETLDRYEAISDDALYELQSETDIGDDIDHIDLLKALYKPEDIIWIGASNYDVYRPNISQGEWVEAFEAGASNDFWCISGATFKPNACGQTAKGDPSYRQNGIADEECYMVLEMDDGEEDQRERFTGFCFELAKMIPLVAIIDSGNKSRHHFFHIRHLEKSCRQSILELANIHMCDVSVATTFSGVVRFTNTDPQPQGRKQNGELTKSRRAQPILMLDPAAREKEVSEGSIKQLRKWLLDEKSRLSRLAGEEFAEENPHVFGAPDDLRSEIEAPPMNIDTYVTEYNTYKHGGKFFIEKEDFAGFETHSIKEGVLQIAIARGLARQGINQPYVDPDATAEEKKTDEYLLSVQELREYKKKVAEVFATVMLDRPVDCEGSVAGQKCGIAEIDGSRWLITREPMLIKSKPHDDVANMFPNIKAIMDNAFTCDDARDTFLAWVRHGVKIITNGTREPSQMVVLCGKAGSGKTLIASIVKKLFGGRSTDPTSSWSKRIAWNDHLLGSELLLMDDSESDKSQKERESRGSLFKSAIYSDEATIDKRNYTSFQARPVWKVMVCCNESEKDLAIVPPLGDSNDREGMADKLCLYNVQPLDLPFLQKSKKDKWITICNELAYFQQWLMNDFVLRDELKGGDRDCCIAYKDDYLVELLQYEVKRDDTLLEMIREYISTNQHGLFDDPNKEILLEYDKRTKPAKIFGALSSSPKYRDIFRNMYSNPNMVGRDLMELVRNGETGVRIETSGKNRFYIFPSDLTDDNCPF